MKNIKGKTKFWGLSVIICMLLVLFAIFASISMLTTVSANEDYISGNSRRSIELNVEEISSELFGDVKIRSSVNLHNKVWLGHSFGSNLF